MEKFELVLRQWTEIGSHGFRYYWDPEWTEPLTGCKELHFMNPSAGYAVQRTVNPDQAASFTFITWFVPHAYKEVEDKWLRNQNR